MPDAGFAYGPGPAMEPGQALHPPNHKNNRAGAAANESADRADAEQSLIMTEREMQGQ
jgi:hypothetical protein